MENEKRVISCVFILAMLWAVDFVTASRVTADKNLTNPKVRHRKTMINTTMRDALSFKRRKRSVVEESHDVNGDAVCGGMLFKRL